MGVSVASLMILATLTAAGKEPMIELSVMSFNIRYGTADDGGNVWRNRREVAFDMLRRHKPDVIGMQEVLAFQRVELLAALPEYEGWGIGRELFRRGEQSCILYRKDKLRRLAGGTFWLSETPEKTASMSWGTACTRICTWARFEHIETKGRFYIFNTHLDHQSGEAQRQGVRLIWQRIEGREHKEPFILTGDFNAGEGSDPVRFLSGEADGKRRMVNAFRAIHPKVKDVRTWHDFRGGTQGGMIDYVLTGPGIEVLDAAIVRDAKGGRYPSDHYPVTARVRIKRGTDNGQRTTDNEK